MGEQMRKVDLGREEGRRAVARLLGERAVPLLLEAPVGVDMEKALAPVAREAGYGVYRIDLSMVISKYIGETEKNLEQVFGREGAAGALLLFDEADALFGRREEAGERDWGGLRVSELVRRARELESAAAFRITGPAVEAEEALRASRAVLVRLNA